MTHLNIYCAFGMARYVLLMLPQRSTLLEPAEPRSNRARLVWTSSRRKLAVHGGRTGRSCIPTHTDLGILHCVCLLFVLEYARSIYRALRLYLSLSVQLDRSARKRRMTPRARVARRDIVRILVSENEAKTDCSLATVLSSCWVCNLPATFGPRGVCRRDPSSKPNDGRANANEAVPLSARLAGGAQIPRPPIRTQRTSGTHPPQRAG